MNAAENQRIGSLEFHVHRIMKSHQEFEVIPATAELIALVDGKISSIREELFDNPYLVEARQALASQLYRSAIGNIWNVVIDDLRNKVIHRSLELFNKAISANPALKNYDSFIENQLSDDRLIEGAYKIGVIGLEASKILKHSKETRHWFYGHPKSSQPSPIKVLSMLDDCVKYVLSQPYPAKIIDIDDYMAQLNLTSFDRNAHAIEMALEELPEDYKEQLSNKLYSAYVHQASSSTLRSNVEFVVPVLWPFLPKAVKIQVAKRVDQQIAQGDKTLTDFAFSLINLSGTASYLTSGSRKYKLAPLIAELKGCLDDFPEENRLVSELKEFANVVPISLVKDLVWGLTHTYVGRRGSSPHFHRTDFYADQAAAAIPDIFESADDLFADKFVEVIKESPVLRGRIRYPEKLARLRRLAVILHNRVSTGFSEKSFLALLVDPAKEPSLLRAIDKK